ncbi:T9SS type B sorting domain-containing protein, partial [Flavobacterium humi]
GWDGTFNNLPLPATDYWFIVYYTEENQDKEFKSHFALKR